LCSSRVQQLAPGPNWSPSLRSASRVAEDMTSVYISHRDGDLAVPQDLHGQARVDIKAPRGAARAADSDGTAALPPGWPLAPVGWRERQRRGRRTRGSHGAAADFAREPSRRPSSGKRGQARSQPNPLTSVRAAAPCQIRRSVTAELVHRHHYCIDTQVSLGCLLRRSEEIPHDRAAAWPLARGIRRSGLACTFS
jgi:hypothetical protein